MLLAIDTATDRVSLALGDGADIMAEHNWLCAYNHTVELAPQVDHMLRAEGISADSLEAVAVGIGPGSFTGLRIGLAFAKGFALSHGLPIVGVPTLDIVAYGQPKREGILIAVLSAGRDRIAAQAYRWHEGYWKSNGPAQISDWHRLLNDLYAGSAHVCGEIDAVGRDTLQEQVSFASPHLNVRRGACLIAIARHRLSSGQMDDPNDLAPVYLQSPDAGRQQSAVA